jgi:zinc transport system permease protein
MLALLAGVVLLAACGGTAAIGDWLGDAVVGFSRDFEQGTFFSTPALVSGLIGVVLVSLICGSVSALVVSNRMAFFSDALAHCAFAGVSIGVIAFLLAGYGRDLQDLNESLLLIMIAFGVAMGSAIAYVRESTTLANDTIIGVFFAGAMGLGAVLLKAISKMGVVGFNVENFLFGDWLALGGRDLVYLVLLLVVTVAFLGWKYNAIVFSSFNPSLARSRGFGTRVNSYLFIILLAAIVNVCLKVVGALLINALLVIPAATACNLARNLRQFFWLSVSLSLASGLAGIVFSYHVYLSVPGVPPIPLVSGGVIVVISVVLFFASIFLGRLVQGQRATVRPGV